VNRLTLVSLWVKVGEGSTVFTAYCAPPVDRVAVASYIVDARTCSS